MRKWSSATPNALDPERVLQERDESKGEEKYQKNIGKLVRNLFTK